VAPELPERLSFSPFAYVFAILTVDRDWVAQTYEGTGFCVASGLLITCWHCVRRTLPEGLNYAAAYAPNAEQGPLVQLDLSDIAKDQNGADLATATIQYAPPRKLSFNQSPEVFGSEVWTFGYPLSGHREAGARVIVPRLLKGYVTRTFHHDRPGFGPTRAIELDMPAPAGLSGAPLFRANTATLLGVVYGETESYTITETEQIDPETGVRLPESRKVITFGVAHRWETIMKAGGPATRGLSVEDYVRLAAG